MADNEAKIIISADPAQFVKFMTDAARSFRDLEKEGKKSLKELDSSWSTFQKGAAEASKAILKEVAGPMLDPMKQAFARALGDAREWRQESTRIMGATGTDWKTIGGEIDAVSLRTKRMPEDKARYLDSVRSLTGSWKFAKDSAEDYSDLSRTLGKQTLAEMAPLASTMQNIFGVDKIKPFFDQAIAGARQLGQSGVYGGDDSGAAKDGTVSRRVRDGHAADHWLLLGRQPCQPGEATSQRGNVGQGTVP